MVHGVVQGGPDSGYRSVLWTELVATGVDRVIEWYQPQLPLPIHIIRLAKKVVSSFGPELIVPVTAALLSCKFHESEEDWIPAHTEEEVAVVRAILFESTQVCFPVKGKSLPFSFHGKRMFSLTYMLAR